MTDNSGFFEDVYDVVRQIPKGKVTTYGAIANFLGTRGSARLVGWAMNAVVDREDIPAHRVVNREGLLTGKMHFATPTEMQEKLEGEGIVVENDQIKEFETHLWDPNTELSL